MELGSYTYIGIDPGLSGALVCITPSGAVRAKVVPTIKQSKGSSKRLYDVPEMVRILEDWKSRFLIGLVALEKGRAAPGQGVTSMFRFGHGCGLWEGMLAALHLPYMIVHPNVWQRSVCTGLTGDPKARAVQAASSMLPNLNLRATRRSTKPHQGIADAACLAMHARKFHLGETG